MGGMVTYTRNLLPQILQRRPELRVTLFVSERGRATFEAEPWSADVRLVSHAALGRRYVSALSELALLPGLVARSRADVLHSLAMTGPVRVGARHVVTVPDLIWRRFPSSGRATVAVWRAVVPPVARGARRVITYSDASRRDIVSLLHVDPGRIDVIPLGTSDSPPAAVMPAGEVRAKFDLGSGPIVLSVSSKRPHKNLLRLTEAMGVVTARHPDAVLVIPGSPTPYEDELRAEAARGGVRLLLPDWVSAAELEGLYAAATCVAFPSLQEGFGLPVLDAMRRGVPVACSNVSSLPEVGGEAVNYFDPTHAEDIARGVLELLDDPDGAARLARAGLERAREFTWEAVAERHLETYERALDGA
jgi:glycosyltransferase involved in cell wall biosynthesis